MSDLLKAAGWAFEIVKQLTEATINHGGRDYDTRRILSDPALVATLAKTIVGPIWDLVGKPVSLDVNWESTLPEFAKKTRVNRADLVLKEEDDRAETALKPMQPCQYTLVHYERPIPPETVMGDHPVAGFRELCTYLSAVQVPPGTKIIALGSYMTYENGTVFALAEVQREGASVARIHNRYHYGPDYFFLVRVPVTG